jgi:hypothetical protein
MHSNSVRLTQRQPLVTQTQFFPRGKYFCGLVIAGSGQWEHLFL